MKTELYTLNTCSLLCADNSPIKLAQEKQGKGKRRSRSKQDGSHSGSQVRAHRHMGGV